MNQNMIVRGLGPLHRAVSVIALTAALTCGPAAAVTLFNNTNPQGVLNHPPGVATFSLGSAAHIDQIITYHWNNGRGDPPGTLSLVNASTGQTVGTWPASGSSGQGGAPNVNWTASPNVNVPAGNYRVVDSKPGTWSYNGASRNAGFVIVNGSNVVLKSVPVPPVVKLPPPPVAQPPPRVVTPPPPRPGPAPLIGRTNYSGSSAGFQMNISVTEIAARRGTFGIDGTISTGGTPVLTIVGQVSGIDAGGTARVYFFRQGMMMTGRLNGRVGDPGSSITFQPFPIQLFNRPAITTNFTVVHR